MRRYKVITGGGWWGVEDGDTVDIDITPSEENEMVAAGRLEILPATYKVVGNQEVYGTKSGKEFEAALSAEQEAALIEGGHIKRVDEKAKGGKKSG